jgi:uncharacterized membrane protein
MLELLTFWGFLGGLVWSLAGFFGHGKPAKNRNIPIALLVTGFVGVVSVYAVFYFAAEFYQLASWKVSVVGILAGYVGADILNSMFEILRNRNINL